MQSDARCAVHNDGIRSNDNAIRSNANGKPGTGDDTPRLSTMVAPAAVSVRPITETIRSTVR